MYTKKLSGRLGNCATYITGTDNIFRAGDYGSLETHNLPRLRQEFETGTQAAIDYYDSVYNLVEYIDGERSRWFIHQAVSFATRQNIARRQRYAMRSQDGRSSCFQTDI